MFERADCLFDQACPVVKRYDGDFGDSPVGQGFLGKSGRHLLDFVFYIINDFQRVGTIPGDHDTADCFDTFFIQPAAPRTRTDIYKRYIGDAYRYTVTTAFSRSDTSLI